MAKTKLLRYSTFKLSSKAFLNRKIWTLIMIKLLKRGNYNII